jgi:ADP-ribose pyrophosphatase YjhB (NUDIX family)
MMRLEAYAVLADERGQVLLVPAAGEWDLPGGPIADGEALEAALMRLVKETTGWDVAVGPLTGVYQQLAHARLAFVFRVELLAGHPNAGRWVAATEATTLVKPATALRVRDALRYRDHAFIRIQ